MPSDLLLDPEDLLAPLPGDDPAGRRVSLIEANKLKEYQEDFDPERDLSEDERRDPRWADAKRTVPQWNKIVEEGTKFLKSNGKDLEVSVRVAEALTKRGGFAGLKTGLRLLRRLCEECWDRMHPALDPDDPEAVTDRTSKLDWLDDAEKKPYFPTTIRAVPILVTPDGVAVSYLACQQQGNRPPEVSQEEFRQAVNTARPADVEQVRLMDEDIGEALDELRGLQSVLDARAGSAAPGFVSVRKALDDCRTVTQQVLRIRDGGPAAAADGQPQPGGGLVPAGGPAVTMGGVVIPAGANPQQVRDQIYAQLERLAGMLEDYDPHSPVTFLVRRAIELRGMKFPDLVDVLTRDAKVIDFLRNPVGGESPTA
jgi:type VI secretion system protein ImpA